MTTTPTRREGSMHQFDISHPNFILLVHVMVFYVSPVHFTLLQSSTSFQPFNHKLHSVVKHNPILETRSCFWIRFPPYHYGVQDCKDIINKNPYQQIHVYSRVQVLTLGSNAWRSSVCALWRLEQGPAEALLNGALHWVTTRHKHQPGHGLHIVSFDVAEDKFKEIERPGCGSLDICNFHLVVIYGCLSAVVCHDGGQLDKWVMKEYGVKGSWTKEYVIGDRLFRSLSERKNALPSSRIWKKPTLSKGRIQVLCSLRNGEMLLEYENGALVSYNPETDEFRPIAIDGLPKWFCTIVHFETLYPADVILQTM